MLNLLEFPEDPALTGADWSKAVAMLARIILDSEGPYRISGSNVLRGSLFNVGGAVYVADSDTAISGTASPYVKITPAGTVASAAFVANLSGVSWNDAYNGYYDASGNLYVFDEMKAYGAGAIASLKTIKNWVPSIEVVKMLSAAMSTGWAGSMTKALITDCNTVSIVASLPSANYPNYNRSLTKTIAASSFNNSDYRTFAQITISAINRMPALLAAIRLHIKNDDSNSSCHMRAIIGETVLDTWSDAHYIDREFAVGAVAAPGAPIVISLQYLEYGASNTRGPFTITASIGLVDDADLPSLNELIFNVSGGLSLV